MSKLTLDYWQDGGGYVGRLREVPEVISQGKTVSELRANIADAFRLTISDAPKLPRRAKSVRIPIETELTPE